MFFRHDDAKVIISHLNFFGGRADTSVFVKVLSQAAELCYKLSALNVIPIITECHPKVLSQYTECHPYYHAMHHLFRT